MLFILNNWNRKGDTQEQLCKVTILQQSLKFLTYIKYIPWHLYLFCSYSSKTTREKSKSVEATTTKRKHDNANTPKMDRNNMRYSTSYADFVVGASLVWCTLLVPLVQNLLTIIVHTHNACARFCTLLRKGNTTSCSFIFTVAADIYYSEFFVTEFEQSALRFIIKQTMFIAMHDLFFAINQPINTHRTMCTLSDLRKMQCAVKPKAFVWFFDIQKPELHAKRPARWYA